MKRADAEKKVIRAAMRWYRMWGRYINARAYSFPRDRSMARACAKLAALKKGKP